MNSPGSPSMHVLFGQPDHLSTSYQTGQLIRAARAFFTVTERHFSTGREGRYATQAKRLWSNYVQPRLRQPASDFVFYGNDGFADLRVWKAQSVVYWYDAPWNWAESAPAPRQWKDWLRYQNIRHADHVFAVSAIQVETARRLRPGREDSVHYLPVGVDCEYYDPAKGDAAAYRELYRLPDKITVGYLGYLAGVHGRFAGQPLAEVAGALSRNHDLHFLIVGFGPALETFREYVARENLSSRFTFTGHVPTEHLPGLLACMDICIDTLEPGFHSEARSETKLKQYMSMGRACVATAIGENRVDLDQGACGRLVEPGKEALQAGVESLVNDPGLRAESGRASRRRALSLYDWPVLAKRMAEALLKSL